MVAPLYAVRVVHSKSNFSKAFPVGSNIAEHNILKTGIGMTFTPAPMSILYLISILGHVLLSFVAFGIMCTLW